MSSDMDTFAARLASFDTVLKPEKRRSSTTKGSRVVAWPHQRPSPAELAHAGFYYKPYETNPDNTTCFECGRALDGWEEEDNPVTEHLKHSPDCGWAIIMDIQQRSSNPTTIEDPTSERITQARLATFGAAWPHDGKRGWVCQSEKMVEGGWYFCPNEESNDLASCAYCKLSLDGWEPKDDPFDEHYRRSSDCSFFVFAQAPAKKSKTSRSKKPRTSKVSSRLSTQSVATTTSETPDMDVDEPVDQSISSQATLKPKSSKKGSKSKNKSAKSKKEEPEVESQMDVDGTEDVQPEPPKTKRAARSKKRTSEEINNDEPQPVAPEAREPSPAEPPTKRRATRTRSSSISHAPNYDQHDYEMPDAAAADEQPQEEERKKGRKGTKKGASKNQKGSDVSTASKTTSKARPPRDSGLEAEIEADLEADAPKAAEQEPEVEQGPDAEPEPEPAKSRTSKKAKTGKKSKAVSKSSESPAEDPVDQEDAHDQVPEVQTEPLTNVEGTEAPAAKTAKSSMKKGSKKSKKDESRKAEASTARESSEAKSAANDRAEYENHESFVSVEIINREAGPPTEPEETVEKSAPKKPKKKDEKAKKSKKSKKTEQSPPPEPPELIEPEPVEEQPYVEKEPMEEKHDSKSQSDDDSFETPDEMSDQVEMVEPPQAPSPGSPQSKQRTPVPPKTTKRYSDIPHEEHLAESLTESQGSRSSGPREAARPSNNHVSPLPVVHQGTPSLSPQSSDAENRPPSSRPPASRAALTPTAKEQKTRTPLAVSTPSPTKRNFNGGFAASAHPWTPVDIDEALFGESSDKENADLAGLFNGVKGGLTSPEKKMTVEEWIVWNAKSGEERLKRECERLVGQFEKEGSRAMQRLEAIECID
ncbi:uncharacterized protein N7459_007368 [Penicillium hispanicum]|uniref:uncharacterized protein n=1 Tax=Penicillium hispanicum TaxID=1080232 RepID=UPI002541E6CE|nr:uncharacterized protein N7459_007368 [Penicillium hispanicum]KAJ5578404.1 hypothetical protein N7459_007368 [Penicillium hispanicum]